MKHERPLLLLCILVIAISLIMPTYGEVLSFKTDKTFYGKTSTIAFSGTVQKDDYGKLVTIVIDDPSGEFVQLIQILPDVDNKFQKSIDVSKFYTVAGIYNTTAFVTAKTNGMSIDFDIEKQRLETTLPVPGSGNEQEDTVQDTQTNQNTETDEDEKTIQEKINERIAANKQKESQTGIINETSENMTNKTDGSSAVITDENKPANELSSNLLYIVIGLGGAGAAGAVIYGVKNKFRHKIDPSSYFAFEEKNELSQKEATQSDDDYALMILKNRLAKGEITIDEFNELKKALKEL